MLKVHTVKLVIDEELTEESIFRNLRSVTFGPGRLDLDKKGGRGGEGKIKPKLQKENQDSRNCDV